MSYYEDEDYEPTPADYTAAQFTAPDDIQVTLPVGMIMGGIRQAIIQEIARQLIKNEGRAIVAEARQMAEPVIEAKIGEMVMEAMTATYQPVNEFGEPKGEKTTLRDTVIREARGFMDQHVNSEGKVSTYYGDNKKPRWQWYADQILTDMTAKYMATAMAAYVREAKAKVDAAVQEALGKRIENTTK